MRNIEILSKNNVSATDRVTYQGFQRKQLNRKLSRARIWLTRQQRQNESRDWSLKARPLLGASLSFLFVGLYTTSLPAKTTEGRPFSVAIFFKNLFSRNRSFVLVILLAQTKNCKCTKSRCSPQKWYSYGLTQIYRMYLDGDDDLSKLCRMLLVKNNCLVARTGSEPLLVVYRVDQCGNVLVASSDIHVHIEVFFVGGF